MAEQDFSEIARLSERLEKDPKSRIFVQLADAYRKSDMVDEAIEILTKGLAYHPQYALAYLILGRCYLRKRMFAQARESFEKTLTFDAQNIVAFRMLAQTCESLKDEAGQIHAYKGILTLDPFDAAAKEKLTLLESRQTKEPLYTISLAQEYEKQGEIAKALSIYENLLFTDPTDLLLQQKVKELKDLSVAEKKQAAPEKIEGLEVDTVFKREDVVKTAEPQEPQVPFTLPETKPVPEIVEQTPPSPPPEQAPEEEIISLEELLISTTPEEPRAPAVHEEPQSIETGDETAKPSEEPEPPSTRETELIIERGPRETSQETVPAQEVKDEKQEPPPAPPTEEAKTQAPEKPPPQPEVKKDATKEEDFQSFKEWLSGLLK